MYGIVKNHAGHIQVTSSPGLGTLFRIYMPAVEATKRVESRASEPLETAYIRGDETILLIDDDDMVLKVLQKNLETHGFKVLKARDGEEALRIARTHPDPIDLAILDMGMPGMDGAEVFPLLKTVRPDMRVLICSGYEMDRTSSAMLKQGASGFLPKPFEMSRLVPEVHKALSRKD